MYQVVINDKYYVSDIEGTISQNVYGIYDYIEYIKITRVKSETRFFEQESEAKSIAEQVGGKVIEYVEKRN